jgi:hypothetical protein
LIGGIVVSGISILTHVKELKKKKTNKQTKKKKGIIKK